MPDTIDRARTLIHTHLADLDAEAAGLRRALEGLGERAVTSKRRPGRPKKRRVGKATAPKPRAAKPKAAAAKATTAKVAGKPRRRKTVRAPRGQRRNELLAAIKANPGTRPSELASAIGVSANQVHALIAKARKDKLLVKRGKGYALKS